MRKFWLIVAIIISTIVAVLATIYLLGGRLLMIKLTMHSNLPGWLLRLLWGWY